MISGSQSVFEEMTDEICRLVLNDNFEQSLCLSLEQRRSAEDPDLFLHVADRLEASGFLDREVEAFGANKEIKTRPGQMISRPELAVLMAASKRYLTHLLMERPELLADECYEQYLNAYFPSRFNIQFKEYLAGHPLADAIKATVISNKLINGAGAGFLNSSDNNGNFALLSLIDCYLAYDLIIEAGELRHNINTLTLSAERQYQLLLQLERTLSAFSHWSSRHGRPLRPDSATVKTYRNYLEEYATCFQLTDSNRQDLATGQEEMPPELCRKLNLIANGGNFPFLVSLAQDTGLDFGSILAGLGEINGTLGLDTVRSGLNRVSLRDVWERKIARRPGGGRRAAERRITQANARQSPEWTAPVILHPSPNS